MSTILQKTDIIELIKKYAGQGSKVYHILLAHSESVKNLALLIAGKNPHLSVNHQLLAQAAMLHDIGIVETYAPDIGCHGHHPYICHGYLGREILEAEGLYDVAPFCERHTGTGISKAEIILHKLPLPHRDMLPVSVEEQILCYADKFFSKSGKNLHKPKKLKKIYANLSKYGEDKARRFDDFIGKFGLYYIYANE
jgi:uncharacterized protein